MSSLKDINISYFSKSVLLLLFHLSFSFYLNAQKSNLGNFFSLTCPEKKWVILHPFIAKKAYDISIEAKNVADNMANDRQLDGDKNGGQIDAFRHAYWMARLTQEISWRKALRLGRAHEKGNKIYFRKNKNEDGSVPDAVSCKMDLLNNEIGIKIGLNNLDSDSEILIFKIRKEILNGNLWIIKKDFKGNFLNINDEIIAQNKLKGIWDNDKCIVESNYLYK